MISWNTDVNAPCCPGEIVDDETGDTILIQTDWDYPGTANSFGWSPRNVQQARCECGQQLDWPYTIQAGDPCGPDGVCEVCCRHYPPCDHSFTDGTVECPECGVTADEFIAAAGEWLRDNDGATAEDPGYFNG